MPAHDSHAKYAQARAAFVDVRRSERRTCNMAVSLLTAHGEIRARLLDLSAGGIGFSLDTILTMKPGDRIVLSHPQLGEVACVLRWAMPPRFGAEFETGGFPALVRAYYDGLAPSTGGAA